MQQFIDEHSKSPNISFRTINIIDETLRRHIDRRTNVNVFKFVPTSLKWILCEFCESKISDLCSAVMHEDICNFEISVYDILLCQIVKSFIDVFNHGFGPVLIKALFLS